MPITKQARFILGIENVQVIGELKMILPKLLKRKCKSKLICIELTKIWQRVKTYNERIKKIVFGKL